MCFSNCPGGEVGGRGGSLDGADGSLRTDESRGKPPLYGGGPFFLAPVLTRSYIFLVWPY